MMTLTIERQARRTASSAVLDSMRQGFGALLSIYVRDVLHSTPAEFGVLNTLIGIGMIVGTQLLTRLRATSRSRTWWCTVWAEWA